MEEEITPSQGIAAFLINVQTTAAGYQKTVFASKAVVNPFQIVFPVPVFVNCVENDQRRAGILPGHFFKKRRVLEEPGPLFEDIGDILGAEGKVLVVNDTLLDAVLQVFTPPGSIAYART